MSASINELLGPGVRRCVGRVDLYVVFRVSVRSARAAAIPAGVPLAAQDLSPGTFGFGNTHRPRT